MHLFFISSIYNRTELNFKINLRIKRHYATLTFKILLKGVTKHYTSSYLLYAICVDVQPTFSSAGASDRYYISDAAQSWNITCVDIASSFLRNKALLYRFTRNLRHIRFKMEIKRFRCALLTSCYSHLIIRCRHLTSLRCLSKVY